MNAKGWLRAECLPARPTQKHFTTFHLLLLLVLLLIFSLRCRLLLGSQTTTPSAFFSLSFIQSCRRV
jgi:hypothetical protein